MPARAPGLLRVEGAEDREIIYQVCNEAGIDNQRRFEVKVADGVEGLLSVAGQPPASQPVVGYVLDADEAPADRWRALRDRLLRQFPPDHLPASVDRLRPGGSSRPGGQPASRGWGSG